MSQDTLSQPENNLSTFGDVASAKRGDGMKDQVAIIGYGYVGKAMHKIFPNAVIYDPFYTDEIPDSAWPNPSQNQFWVNKLCNLAIVCVPTPMQDTDDEFKRVDLSIVEETIKWINCELILIKSTVPPGTVDRLIRETDKKICFSPEYIGEGKYHITEWKYMSPTNPRLHEFQIIGGDPRTRDRICNFFVRELGPEKTYYLVDAMEAELIKYMENSWGAMKVIFCQEMFDLCQKLGISYHRVREGWALDNRVEKMHTAVFVDERGFGGKCYPKDVNGIVALADDIGVDMSLLKAVLRKNGNYNPDK